MLEFHQTENLFAHVKGAAAMNYPPYPYGSMQPYPPRPDMQSYPQMPSQQIMQSHQTPMQAAQGLSPASRPVTNREEANAVSADFSGALMVFPDITNNRVYIKRWNLQAGAAEFIEFVPAIQAPPVQGPLQKVETYAPLQDLLDLQSTVENLQKEINRLKKPMGKAVKKSEQSDDE